MKRYWIFIYDEYYPGGGMEDFNIDFNNIDECNNYLKERDPKLFYHVFDSVKGEVIKYNHLPNPYDGVNYKIFPAKFYDDYVI
jgi:hypothetical protein